MNHWKKSLLIIELVVCTAWPLLMMIMGTMLVSHFLSSFFQGNVELAPFALCMVLGYMGLYGLIEALIKILNPEKSEKETSIILKFMLAGIGAVAIGLFLLTPSDLIGTIFFVAPVLCALHFGYLLWKQR